MLSDEEKEALRNFKSEYETCDHYSSDLIIELDDAEILLNLIEKQSKEIEELKENIHLKEVYVLKTNDYIKGTNVEDELCNKKWEDKIKTKIEEWDMKDLTICYGGRSQGRTFQQAVHYEVKKVLKSLLERE